MTDGGILQGGQESIWFGYTPLARSDVLAADHESPALPTLE